MNGGQLDIPCSRDEVDAATVNAVRLCRLVRIILRCDEVFFDTRQTAASCSSVQTMCSDVDTTARGPELTLTYRRTVRSASAASIDFTDTQLT